jgi:hypothetical protein
MGLSPWFLLLGSTSSAAGMLNMCDFLHSPFQPSDQMQGDAAMAYREVL